MVKRHFWLQRIQSAWKHRSVVWLSGVRRVGKTCLCQSLPDVEYFDCELPRVRRLLEQPESFLQDMRGRTLILDEIHRLDNPSELLKIAADHHPATQILATGSSTLGASSKFKDTLTGRKAEIWLTPMMSADLSDFNQRDLKYRLMRGGLPPFFLAESLPERDFQEWMDAYWAKDIQELFRLERRHSFQKFAELLMQQSGGIFEATSFARPCEVSRPTINNYLKVLEATFIVHVIRPFSSNPQKEIVAAPKVYAFDTGFICYHKGWQELRPPDLGYLWEHYVLNELHAQLQTGHVQYWRDKRGHEVDFVFKLRGQPPLAVECKWSADDFDPTNFKSFFRQYPRSEFHVVASDVDRPFGRRYGDLQVRFLGLAHLVKQLAKRLQRS